MFSTFGEYLSNYLTENGFSRRQFSELMGMKSKTGIDRLIANKSSSDTVVKFSGEMIKRLELSDDEIHELKSAVLNHFSTEDSVISQSILARMFFREEIEYNSCCRNLNGEPVEHENLTIDKIMSEIEDNTLIVLEGAVPLETIYAINDLIYTNNREGIKILHFYNSGETTVNLSLQLFALLKLMTHLDYNPYSTLPEYRFNSTFVAFSENDGKYMLRKINYMPNGDFHMLCSSITAEIYNYFYYEYNTLASISKPLRMSPEHTIEGLINHLEWLGEHDARNMVCVENGICFMSIPIEIQKKLFKECDYMGLAEDSEHVRRIIQVQEKRAEVLFSAGKEKRFILARSGIQSFVKTGITGDHFPMFRALNEEEIKATISNLFNSPSKIRILKECYTVSDTNVLVFDREMLFAFDPIWGWWENSKPVAVHNPEFVEIVDDFLKKNVWELCCYDEAQSIEIVREMFSE